jgi:hypothetical protein
MSDVKPEGDAATKPNGAGTPSADGQVTPPAQTDLMEKLSDDHRAYLKGLGIESLDAETIAKVVDSGVKQKQSVSRSSQEIAELKARLESKGQDAVTPPTEEPPAEPPAAPEVPTPPPAPNPVQGQNNGISENDLFDLSLTIHDKFPELREEAADGRLFNELRQLGYFGVSGLKKKEVYEYLANKNSSAQELRELREFKEKYSQPNESSQTTYDFTKPISDNTEMNEEIARSVVLANIQGRQVDPKTLASAQTFLQEKIAK